MASEEVSFLRDQVRRLNDVLSQYQSQYPPLSLQPGKGSDASPPWFSDKSLLSPLVVEYDSVIQQLRREIERYKGEIGELKSHLERLVSENKRLTRELKENIQHQLEDFDSEALKPSTGEDDEVLENLQQQIMAALQEKESAVQMWQEACQEVERLEQQIEDSRNDPRFRHLETQAMAVKEQYTRAVADLTAEVQSLQEQLRVSKNEGRTANMQAAELRQTLEVLGQELLKREQERDDAIRRVGTSDSRETEMREIIVELESKLSTQNYEVDQLKKDKTELDQKLTELQKKNSDLEQKEYEFHLQNRENVQMAENALLEKDQALLREQQQTEENQRLQDQMSKLIDEAGLRTKKEVENIRKQCNNNIAKLMEELQNMEMDNSEKQAQLERAIREKRAVESELEKLYQEGLVMGSKEQANYEELNKRACQAETLRDEAVIKLESLQGNVKRMEMNHIQEKSQLQMQIDQLRERVTTMSQEFEDVNQERMKLLDETDKLKRKMQQAQKEKEAADRKCSKELTLRDQEQLMKERECEVRMQSMEDAHRQSTKELRNMLLQQQRMGAKWKEECQAISQKFEGKITDLRDENGRLKRRAEELTRLLEECKEKTVQAENLVIEYTNNIKKMENRVRDAESRAQDAATQVSKQLARERRMRQERRFLASELDRSQSGHPGVR
ncbi:sodium channel and clathrin linker 1 isoform X2 [Lingula anatina]|nr:sodium channel and clathrin linker 1 isoform X2 [Lingula anatina]|eukprot:XP_013411252.1 sodium channel and clathrin linker 1 isoform X2 [Lingula anatina]